MNTGEMLRDAGKLARLAAAILEDSADLLERVMALASEGVDDSDRVTATIRALQRQLESAAPRPGGERAAGAELRAASAAARLLMLKSAATVVRIRQLIGSATISERYRWGTRAPGASMVQVYADLDELARIAAEAAACWPVARAEIQAVERGIATMCHVARHHRAVAGDALQAVEKLHERVTLFVRMLRQAGFS
ncbi:hypothetical protein [Duganella sp. BJB1802]|uniref:hypothetical protein n=1 Tax=Duganella sp. BJB1802 TaxID=2744575 RepID=UPI001C3D9868|nr:hypothetical protein [Duganella sp. BJB1802]